MAISFHLVEEPICKNKSEIRISKSETNTNSINPNDQNGNSITALSKVEWLYRIAEIQMTPTWYHNFNEIKLSFWSLEYSNLGFVSDFVLRISNLRITEAL